MTPDDEAFVRAVVDRPGDDLPRLVYADWLDERDDPRGPYLRAEAAWAKAPVRGDAADIVRLGQGLDPVWAARVSRPPVGVCCDHLAKSSIVMEVASPEAIDADEATLGVNLPSQLRALLLNYTLGRLRGGPFILPHTASPRHQTTDAFVCLSDPDWDDNSVSYELIERTEYLRGTDGLPERLLFLAGLFEDNAVVSCRNVDPDSVHYWDSFEERSTKLADSIGEFLAMLVPKSWPLTDADLTSERD